ncbi:MAG: hypothetical protein ACAH95_02420 [Fimbriimonas sp.]
MKGTMWNRLKNLFVMDAPEFWDQPLDEFMEDQLAKADGVPVRSKNQPIASTASVIKERRGRTAQERADLEQSQEFTIPI